GLLADEALEVAPQGLLELGALQLGELDADAGAQRLVQAAAEERERRVERGRLDPLRSDLLRQAGVEAVQRRVRDLPSQHRVGLGVDRLRRDLALEQPCRRAVREAFELGDAERRARREVLEHERVPELGAARERARGAVELALPAVRRRERLRRVRLLR